MSNLWKSEPTIIVTIVQAAIVLATSFGLSLTPQQTTAILTLTTLVCGAVVRSQVHSQASVDAMTKSIANPPAKFPDAR